MNPPSGGGTPDGSLGADEPRPDECSPFSGVESLSQLDMHPAADATASWADNRFWIDGTDELDLVKSNYLNGLDTNTVVEDGFSGYEQLQANVEDDGFTGYDRLQANDEDNGFTEYGQFQANVEDNGFTGYGQPQADVDDNGLSGHVQIRADVDDNGLSGYDQIQADVDDNGLSGCDQLQTVAASDLDTPSASRLERSSRATKWTMEMDNFLMNRKVHRDTHTVIARKMRAKFGVSVNPNMLSKRFKLLAKRMSKNTFVHQAFLNSMPKIISTVQEELKRLSPGNISIVEDEEIVRHFPECWETMAPVLWFQVVQNKGIALDNLEY